MYGKSSLINALANNNKLAKIGNTPGKTRSLNYYNINNEVYLVDLPRIWIF
ncbi:MAG: GTPase [Clostridia bacterium]